MILLGVFTEEKYRSLKTTKRKRGKKMKKLARMAAVVGVISLILGLTGCGNSSSTNPAASDDTPAKKSFIIAHAMSEDTCFKNMTDAMEEVLTASGYFDVQVYPAAQLGSDVEGIQATQSGNITFYPTYSGTFASYASPFYVFDKMFAFDDINIGRAVADNQEFLAILNKELESNNTKLVCLGLADMQFRRVSANKTFESLDDFNGLKIRVVDNPIYLKAWKAIGASPTPLSFTELYSGLQQGVIDAQENTPEVTYSCKAYEVQKYIIDTNHLLHYIAMNINADFYNSLTAEERAVVDEAAAAGIKACREAVDASIEKYYSIFAEAGCEHVGIDEALLEQIKASVEPTWTEVESKISPELYAAYNKAIEDASK